MTLRRPRTALSHALISCVMLSVLATPAMAKDEQAVAAGSEAPKATAMSPVVAPVTITRNGGTAIINFVASVSPKTMAELAQSAQNAVIGGADAIRLNISSRGGSLHAVQFAVNVLRNLPVPVETVAMSQIASAAVALYCAGEKRYMADGAALYLHQQRGFEEIQVKTAGAVMRELELSTIWYDDLLRDCVDAGADPSVLDYSALDVVIDSEQARSLGMVTGEMPELDRATIWGGALNGTAPDASPSSGYPFYPSYR